MIETIVSVGLPVDEKLEIKKQRLVPDTPLSGKEKRICITTGIHGDELEGQYVCFELIKRINANKDLLTGIVDVYPALNPLGIDSITRGIPAFDLDMNRIFPGSADGSMAEYTASQIIQDISGADLCMDIHASNIFLKEIPQIRINEISKDALIPLARLANVDYIWIHSTSTVLESTLAYSLNALNTPTLVVEMGVGMRITKKYCEDLVDGIFVLMKELGIWKGDVITPKQPIISEDGNVQFINASSSGIFVPAVEHWKNVKKGQWIGDILNPLEGKVIDKILSPCNGIVFTLREFPVVDEGSLIARILEK